MDVHERDVDAAWSARVKRRGNSRYVTIPGEYADHEIAIIARRKTP